jgi:RimJ/RimL family protein N-acetyltransferase
MFMGLPSLALILAENQQWVAEGLAKNGLAINLGEQEKVQIIEISQCLDNLLHSHKNRIQLSQQGCALIDGRGSERVVKTIRLEKLHLRSVSEQDCELLWHWVNEPDVRQSAFQSEYILWEEHIQWFSKKLADPHCFHFIALNDENVPVGQIRFDVEGAEAEVDVSLDTTKRGSGYGSLLISLGVEQLVRQAFITIIHSWVKLENKASIRAFTKAGFVLHESGLVKQHQCVHLRWKNNGQFK